MVAIHIFHKKVAIGVPVFHDCGEPIPGRKQEAAGQRSETNQAVSRRFPKKEYKKYANSEKPNSLSYVR